MRDETIPRRRGSVVGGAGDPADPETEPAARLPHLPLLATALAHDQPIPTWRGWIHAGTFPVAITLGIVLIVLANGTSAKWACAVFAASSVLLFGMSALYHRVKWTIKVKRILQRVDHANIFILIAGSSTPITVLCLPAAEAGVLLAVMWGGAATGVAIRLAWTTAPRWLFVPQYLLLGYAALAYVVDFFTASAAMMILIIVGGGLYSVGAAIVALKRPNPDPGVFGFHEVFHALTLLAYLCHWAGILIVAVDPPGLAG